MRVRYLVAGAVALIWCVGVNMVGDDWGPGLQFAALAVGMLLSGGIAFPDDFRSNRYLAERDARRRRA